MFDESGEGGDKKCVVVIMLQQVSYKLKFRVVVVVGVCEDGINSFCVHRTMQVKKHAFMVLAKGQGLAISRLVVWL